MAAQAIQIGINFYQALRILKTK